MNKDEILELIDAGFDPELIELEFGVPIEKINKFIKQEEKRKDDERKQAEETKRQEQEKENLKKKPTEAQKTNISRPVQSKPKSSTNHLDVLRKNYAKLTAQTVPNDETLPRYIPPTEAEEATVDEVIKKLQTNLDSIKKLQLSERKEKRQLLVQMIASLKEISKTPKTLNQFQQIRTIFQSPELENLATSRTDNINSHLSKTRRTILEDLSKVVEQISNHTSDLDELLYLSKQIPTSERSTPHLYTSSIKNRIESRISQLRNAQIMYNMRNNVSSEIEDILRSIADNTFDLETAKQAIAIETQRRIDNAPKTKFALSRERHQQQVEIQIRMIISEQGKKYPITNPGLAINNLMQLFSERTKENSFSRVIENLISQGKYDEAKELCSKYIVKKKYDEEEPSMSKTARTLHKNVTLTQIGDMVSEQIQKPSNKEQDDIFISLLEDRMARERITPHQIVIGTAPSGKKITLKDVWYTDIIKQK